MVRVGPMTEDRRKSTRSSATFKESCQAPPTSAGEYAGLGAAQEHELRSPNALNSQARGSGLFPWNGNVASKAIDNCLPTLLILLARDHPVSSEPFEPF